MTNFSTQKERILQFIENKGISKNKFYIETGISNGVLDKKSGLSMETIEKFYSTYPETNPEWLLTGKGAMLKELDTSDIYIRKSNSYIHDNIEPTETYIRDSKKLIPLYDGVVTAGMQETAMLDSAQEPVEMIDAGDWFRDATAAMRVHGDSMYPEYKSGSIAALREVRNKRLVVYGQDYLIETTEYRVIKRLQKSELPQNWLACSVNEEKYESSGRLIHEPFDIHIDDVTRLYQVLGNVKRNQSSTVIQTNGNGKK